MAVGRTSGHARAGNRDGPGVAIAAGLAELSRWATGLSWRKVPDSTRCRVARLFADTWSRYGTLRIKYVQPVPVGDTVRTRLTVAAIEDGLCTMEVHREKADGEPALIGTATCPMPS